MPIRAMFLCPLSAYLVTRCAKRTTTYDIDGTARETIKALLAEVCWRAPCFDNGSLGHTRTDLGRVRSARLSPPGGAGAAPVTNTSVPSPATLQAAAQAIAASVPKPIRVRHGIWTPPETTS
jgi:hypothetical protein